MLGSDAEELVEAINSVGSNTFLLLFYMSFFKNLFDEAGRKTGGAIGNKLFPKSVDYVRIGHLGDDDSEKDPTSVDFYAQKRLLLLEHQNHLMQSLIQISFDPSDIHNNIVGLTKIAAILDSLPSWIDRDNMDKRIHKMAKSMMATGITISKRIDPNNPIIKQFEDKY